MFRTGNPNAVFSCHAFSLPFAAAIGLENEFYHSGQEAARTDSGRQREFAPKERSRVALKSFRRASIIVQTGVRRAAKLLSGAA